LLGTTTSYNHLTPQKKLSVGFDPDYGNSYEFTASELSIKVNMNNEGLGKIKNRPSDQS